MDKDKLTKIIFIILIIVTVISIIALILQMVNTSKTDNSNAEWTIIENNEGDKKVERINNNIFFEYYYDKNNYISMNNAFPISDELGKTNKDNYEYFKLRFNKQALGIKYIITVEKDIDSTLDDEYVKLYLNSDKEIDNCYQDNRVKTFNEYNKYNNNPNEIVLYEGIVNNIDIERGYKEFVFRMWLSSSMNLENSDYLSEAKTYNIRVNVNAIKE